MSSLDRFSALVEHGIREVASGRRMIAVGLLALVPTGLVYIITQLEANVSQTELDPILLVLGLGVVVPVIALLFGVSAIREDLQEGTIVHLVTRAVPRESIFIARVVAAAFVTAFMAGIALTLPVLLMGSSAVDAWSLSLGVAVLASLAYTGLFALLGGLTKRAVLIGLVYLIGWETLVASTPLLFRSWTVAYWLRSIVANQDFIAPEVTQDLLAGAGASTPTAIGVLIAITLAAVGAGAFWFGHREFQGAEPED